MRLACALLFVASSAEMAQLQYLKGECFIGSECAGARQATRPGCLDSRHGSHPHPEGCSKAPDTLMMKVHDPQRQAYRIRNFFAD